MSHLYSIHSIHSTRRTHPTGWSGRVRRPALAVALTAVLLSVVLSGCGDRATGSAQGGAGTTGSAQGGAGSTRGVDQQTAARITSAVNEAEAELDGLDQDFAADR